VALELTAFVLHDARFEVLAFLILKLLSSRREGSFENENRKWTSLLCEPVLELYYYYGVLGACFANASRVRGCVGSWGELARGRSCISGVREMFHNPSSSFIRTQ
jgi:hypothetical protein